jgi:molecular chaperone DnaK (HSP70)
VTESFTTTSNNQTEILFRVFEGERPVTSGNNLLGQFELKGIPPAPREVPKIDVTFSIDANGMLYVQAVDSLTKQSANIVITNNQGRLSKEEIQRMLRDEERFRDADAAERARLDLHAQVESLAHRAKTLVDGPGAGGVPPEDAARVARGADEVLAWLRRSSETSRGELEGEMERLTALLQSANIALKEDDEDEGGRGGTGRRRTNIEEID